jgi:hypothetical protein
LLPRNSGEKPGGNVHVAAVPKRTANEVIDEAIKENKLGEYLLYLFSCTTFFVGIAALGVGAYNGERLTASLGTVASVMFYPAMRLAKKIREQNVAIRLLEIPLNNAKTAEEAALVLKAFFESTISNQKGLPKS